nr:MAG TPA: hypothetical protein [Caudoviricetes sp.]
MKTNEFTTLTYLIIMTTFAMVMISAVLFNLGV